MKKRVFIAISASFLLMVIIIVVDMCNRTTQPWKKAPVANGQK